MLLSLALGTRFLANDMAGRANVSSDTVHVSTPSSRSEAFPAGVMSFASRNWRFARILLIVLRRQDKLEPPILLGMVAGATSAAEGTGYGY